MTETTITVRLFAMFREAAGRKTLHRGYDDTVTVGSVLRDLQTEFGGDHQLLTDDGVIAPSVTVLLNGSHVTHLDGVDTELEPDDTLSIAPPVTGG